MPTIREWLNRLRHNRGYGVQSPAAFHFLMHVLREGRLKYYAYPQINSIAKKDDRHSAAHCRRLFRIANHLHPQQIMSIYDRKEYTPEILSIACNNAEHFCTHEIDRFAECIAGKSTIDMLYIGNTSHYAEALNMALPHTNKYSVIIVDGIRRTRQKRQWWKQIIADGKIIISMDMYNTGLLFFNAEYKKQHYTFWFK